MSCAMSACASVAVLSLIAVHQKYPSCFFFSMLAA